jgi:hypothetical protein
MDNIDFTAPVPAAFDDNVDINAPPITTDIDKPKKGNRLTRLVCVGACNNAPDGTLKVTQNNHNYNIDTLDAAGLRCSLSLDVYEERNKMKIKQ